MKFQVSPHFVSVFNYVAGCVPVLQKFVKDKTNGVIINEEVCQRMCGLLEKLSDFMVENGTAQKYRQKLLRNLMVEYIQC